MNNWSNANNAWLVHDYDSQPGGVSIITIGSTDASLAGSEFTDIQLRVGYSHRDDSYYSLGRIENMPTIKLVSSRTSLTFAFPYTDYSLTDYTYSTAVITRNT